MKYSVSVNGSAFAEVEAATDHDAVDAARAAVEKKTPKEGGDFDVEVSCAVEGPPDSKGRPRPAGVVSSFSVYHEPHESVREAVEAKRAADEAAAEKAAEREALKAELRLEIEAEQKAGGKVEVSK